jgi:hypothetical protein
MDDPQTTIQVTHTVWETLNSLGGLIVAYFVKRVIDQVDKKADKGDLEDLKTDFREWMKQQGEQHRANTARLDTIIDRVGGNRSL